MMEPQETKAPLEAPPSASIQAPTPDSSRALTVTRPPSAGPIGARLLKGALLGVLFVGATEVALGRRLYLVYEMFRRIGGVLAQGERAEEPKTIEGQAAAARSEQAQSTSTSEQALAQELRELADRGQEVVERGKVTLRNARDRARERLKQPGARATMVGASVLGAAAVVGALPTALGAGAAYLVYRTLQAEREAAARQGPSAGGTAAA